MPGRLILALTPFGSGWVSRNDLSPFVMRRPDRDRVARLDHALLQRRAEGDRLVHRAGVDHEAGRRVLPVGRLAAFQSAALYVG